MRKERRMLEKYGYGPRQENRILFLALIRRAVPATPLRVEIAVSDQQSFSSGSRSLFPYKRASDARPKKEGRTLEMPLYPARTSIGRCSARNSIRNGAPGRKRRPRFKPGEENLAAVKRRQGWQREEWMASLILYHPSPNPYAAAVVLVGLMYEMNHVTGSTA
jgi:hypothetical protein